MIVLLTGFVATGFGIAELQQQAPDTTALGIALTHARTAIQEGAILVSPDSAPYAEVSHPPASGPPDAALLERAASVAGLAFGQDNEAMECTDDRRSCHAVGPFRGLVHVVDYRSPDSNSVVVTLRILGFVPEFAPLYERVDEVHVVRQGRTDWRIEKVTRISES